jgi:hypothetical protein
MRRTGWLELAALGALRGVLSDVRAAAGEVQGEIEIVVLTGDGSPIPNLPGSVLVPRSKLPPEWHEGGVVQRSFDEPNTRTRPEVDPELLPDEPPPTQRPLRRWRPRVLGDPQACAATVKPLPAPTGTSASRTPCLPPEMIETRSGAGVVASERAADPAGATFRGRDTPGTRSPSGR